MINIILDWSRRVSGLELSLCLWNSAQKYVVIVQNFINSLKNSNINVYIWRDTFAKSNSERGGEGGREGQDIYGMFLASGLLNSKIIFKLHSRETYKKYI